jgi:hypothetical protein
MTSRRITRTARLLLALALATTAIAQTPSHGPAKGYLLITGGSVAPPVMRR